MKTIKIALIISLAGCLITTNSFSQKIPVANPSPEAAGLGIVGNIPVSYHTGRVDISIPLMEIKVHDYTLPVKLVYNSSGVMPDMRPSWVGQNWTLDVGGVVTRSIKGLPDELEDFGYRASYKRLNTSDWASTDKLLSTQSMPYFLGFYGSDVNYDDTEPDEFFFKANGISGKFYIGEDGKFKVVSEPGTKIECSMYDVIIPNNIYPCVPTFKGFKITSPDGTIYHFGFGADLIETNCTQSAIVQYPNMPAYASSWLLSKIELPGNNDDIIFHYSARKNDESQFSLDLSVASGWRWSDSHWQQYTGNCWSISTDTYFSCISHYYLQSVEGPNFNLGFTTTNAGDKKYGKEVNPQWQKLDVLTLKNNSDETIKSFNFTYQTGANTRLYLTSVKEAGTPAYEFYYDSRKSLDYDMKSIDHWGYYNGFTVNFTDSSSRIAYPFPVQGDNTEYYILNRETDPTCITAGILTQINYPTGGTVDFEFEANDYSQYGRIQNGHFNLENVQKSWSEWKSIEGRSLTVQYGAYYSVVLGGDEVDAGMAKGKLNPGTYPISYFLQQAGLTGNPDDYRFQFPSKYRELNTSSNAYAGGTRIKKISYKDENTEIIKEYQYVKNYTPSNPPTVSSGILGCLPIYNYSININAQPLGTLYSGYYDAYSSQPLSALSLSEGSHVGYSEVVEISKDKNGNSTGYTVYKYTNFDTNPDSIPVNVATVVARDYGARNRNDVERGKLLLVSHFSGNNVKLKETAFTYNKVKRNGLRAIENRRIYLTICTMANVAGYAATAYYINNNSYLPATETEQNYDASSGSLLQTVNTTYTYTDRDLIRSVSVTDSDGSIQKTEKNYPPDYPSSLYQEMTLNNMISPVIEQIVRKNNIEKFRERVDYFKDNGKTQGLIKPEKAQMSAAGENDLRTEITYDLYDAQGNLLQCTTLDNVKTVYLWGYNNQYPIAEIKNAAYSEVSSKINPATLADIATKEEPSASDWTSINNLRSQLPNAQVTTYTYKRLIGMTSATDPRGVTTYYEYDAFGRLKEIYYLENNNRKTIEKYEYHYKN
jgi:YD repeat-containing protein